MKRKIFFSLTAVATLVGTILAGSLSAHAAPRSNNPLHPSYYSDRSNVPDVKSRGRGQTVVDTNAANPLHPNYYAARLTDRVWAPTAKTIAAPYSDVMNPLHPSYKRDHASSRNHSRS